MAAWPVSAIRQKYPDAEITWAVERSCAAVVDESVLVNRVVAFPRDNWKRERWKLRTLTEQIRYYLSLREQGFDLGVDFQGHSKTAMALRISGAKRRVAVQATDAFARSLNPTPLTKVPDLHWVDHHMAVLRTIESFESVERPLMPVLPELPDSFPSGRVISICTGGSSEIKRVPIELWRAVAVNLKAQGFSIVSVGGPGDESLGEGCVDYVGQLNLRASMAVIAASSLHIAPDTGTGHMAAALGTPVISLFGADPLDISAYRPYTSSGIVLSARTPAEIGLQSILDSASDLLA